MKQKNIYFYTNLFAWTLVFLLIGNYVFGWVTPSATPPSSNLPALINESSTAQSKEGYLAVGTSITPTIPLNVSGTANMTTLSIGGTVITATPAELNFIDGVTSAIQTQLNAKEPTINAGTTAQYLRGDKTWQTLPSATDTWITTQTCSTDYALQSVGKTSKVCINKVDYSDVAYDLSCTDCIGTTEIADSYVLNTSDTMSGTLTTGGTFTANTNSTDNYDKIRVYPSASYTIGMKSAQTYGGLGDWAMTFTMNNDTDRGFLWRDEADAVSDGAMSLTTAGVLTVKGTVTAPQFVGGGAGITGVTATNADKLDGYHGTSVSTVNTYALRNASGDINARLFRSEYDTTNATIGYIMTQVDTASNNYIRPSTVAQVKASLGVGPMNWTCIEVTSGNHGCDGKYIGCTVYCPVGYRVINGYSWNELSGNQVYLLGYRRAWNGTQHGWTCDWNSGTTAYYNYGKQCYAYCCQ